VIPDIPQGVDLVRIADALGTTPPVSLAEAHVYPAAAPAYVPSPHAPRERPPRGPLRLYVHLPFCNYKCTFCCFATRVGDSREQQARYTAALARDLEWADTGTPLSQLFVGGGTPTVLAPDLLDRLLSTVFERLPPVEGQVHTVEASPESLSDAHVRVLQNNGIGRVSMGVQSLDNRVLDGVGRRHSRDEVMAAIGRLVGGGLIANIDLMYGLPGQTQESFQADLEAVAERGVHAVTLYSLRAIGPAINRSLKEEERLDLARLLRWRAFVWEIAAEMGFTQTRWHTFKRMDGIAARHERATCFDDNMRGFQLGIGNSARSHLGHTIYRNHCAMPEYIRRVEAGKSPVEEVFELGEEDRRTQFIARTLGDGKPLWRDAYRHAFGNPVESDFGAALERMFEAGLIVENDDSLSLSPIGRLAHDRVMLSFYPKHAIEWLWKQAA
jgi:oxygen-independent coproporphyrinogen-3 oxidase